MYGRACLIRFADDAVMGFESERDARRVMEVLPKRFARYGLTLHPTKTRLVKFVRPPWRDPPKGSGRRCEAPKCEAFVACQGRREGRPGVRASHSTDEAGKLAREDPVEGRGCRIMEPLAGSAAEALCPVRVDAPPDEDPAGQVRPSAVARPAEGFGPTALEWQLRLPGLHLLRVSVAQRKLGGETQDGRQPTESIGTGADPMVPATPAPEDPPAAPDPDAEAARALCVLRHHRERTRPARLLPHGPPNLEEMARSPVTAWPHPVAALCAAAGTSPASAAGRGPFGLPPVANP